MFLGVEGGWGADDAAVEVLDSREGGGEEGGDVVGCFGGGGVEVKVVECVFPLGEGWGGGGGDDAGGSGDGVAGWDYGDNVIALGGEVEVGGDEVDVVVACSVLG